MKGQCSSYCIQTETEVTPGFDVEMFISESDTGTALVQDTKDFYMENVIFIFIKYSNCKYMQECTNMVWMCTLLIHNKENNENINKVGGRLFLSESNTNSYLCHILK